MQREIIHINVAHFMTAVEERLSPRLRGRPLAIARDLPRGIICDVSESAFRAGITRGMFLAEARRLLKELYIIDPNPPLYQRAQEALFNAVLSFSPCIEQGERGHLFIDATGTGTLFGPPADLAAQLRRVIKKELALSPAATHASNKLVAKVASRVVKPDGYASISHGSEAPFLSPQQVALLPGVGTKIERTLRALGVETMGVLASLSQPALHKALGPHGPKLALLARGHDNTPVTGEDKKAAAITGEALLSEDSADPEILLPHLFLAVEEAGIKLRLMNRYAAHLSLTLRYADDRQITGGSTLCSPLYTDTALFREAAALCNRLHTRRVRIKQLCVTLSKLTGSLLQLDLFTPPGAEKEQQLQQALDTIRRKYDRSAVCWARSMTP